MERAADESKTWVTEAQADIPIVADDVFAWPLGEDAAVILRTQAIANAHFALVKANYQRLAQWFPDAYQEPPTLDAYRNHLELAGQAWLDGSLLPLSIAVKAERGWRLVGWTQLVINRSDRSAEIGYWLDADFEGNGLVTRAATAMLDHAFGTLDLQRVGLPTTVNNTRSRSVAERLGFTQEGILREAAAFPTGRRDVVLYGLLAREWRQTTAGKMAPEFRSFPRRDYSLLAMAMAKSSAERLECVERYG